MYTDVHFSSGATSHPKTKIVVAEGGVAVASKTDDAVLRAIAPATAANDAETTGCSTLRVNYKSAVSSIIYCRIIIIPIKTPFPYIPAHIV